MAISSSTLLKRLRSGARKNATYTAFREVGRVIRTVRASTARCCWWPRLHIAGPGDAGPSGHRGEGHGRRGAGGRDPDEAGTERRHRPGRSHLLSAVGPDLRPDHAPARPDDPASGTRQRPTGLCRRPPTGPSGK
ncbi:Tn3 family transposase [Streptomyces javensis]|uniref:Tn3 family transposase n=1 Tax=Streptomyces javensis TaxID=114698 RepID=UPI0033F55C69